MPVTGLVFGNVKKFATNAHVYSGTRAKKAYLTLYRYMHNIYNIVRHDTHSMSVVTLDDRRSTHVNRGGLITASLSSSPSSSSSSARTRLCAVQSSVDVRTFEPQHDANPDCVTGAPATGRLGGPVPTAAEAVPH